MAQDKIAAVFDIAKLEDDYIVEHFDILHSHPSLEQVFLFHEDLLSNFLDDNKEWDKLSAGRIYRFFVVIGITPEYSTNYEYGTTDLDGWIWDILVLTHEDLGMFGGDTDKI